MPGKPRNSDETFHVHGACLFLFSRATQSRGSGREVQIARKATTIKAKMPTPTIVRVVVSIAAAFLNASLKLPIDWRMRCEGAPSSMFRRLEETFRQLRDFVSRYADIFKGPVVQAFKRGHCAVPLPALNRL